MSLHLHVLSLLAALVFGIAGAHAQAPHPPLAPLEGAGYPPPVLEPKPPSGIGAIIVGYAGLGWAVMNLATLPLCTLDFYEQHDATAACYGVSAAIVGVALAVAIPSLVIGHARRREYKTWRAKQQALALLSKIRVTPVRENFVLGYSRHW